MNSQLLRGIDPYLIVHGIEPVFVPIRNKNGAGMVTLNQWVPGILLPVNKVGRNSHIGCPQGTGTRIRPIRIGGSMIIEIIATLMFNHLVCCHSCHII